jgi:hypothetical protein
MDVVGLVNKIKASLQVFLLKNHDFRKTWHILHELAAASCWRVCMASWVSGLMKLAMASFCSPGELI